jgi:hypothetical protein
VVTDWGEEVPIFKAGVLFQLHTLKTRGFISKLATNCTSEIDAMKPRWTPTPKGRDAITAKQLAEPRASTLWSRLGEWSLKSTGRKDHDCTPSDSISFYTNKAQKQESDNMRAGEETSDKGPGKGKREGIQRKGSGYVFVGC